MRGYVVVNKFEFIKKLQNHEQIEETVEKKPKIEYQQYEIMVDSSPIEVLIPVRECSNFENKLNEYDSLTSKKLRELLRTFRGIKKRD